MAYIPTVWATGDVITAEKLNKMENGIADVSAYIVPVVYDADTSTTILQASFDDISSAVSAGRTVMTKDDLSNNETTISLLYRLSYIADAEYPYHVYFYHPDDVDSYVASTSTDNLIFEVE